MKERKRVEWRLTNRVGRANLDMQRKRVAFGHRRDGMIDLELVKEGLYTEEIPDKKNEDQIGVGKIYVPLYKAKNRDHDWSEDEINALDMAIQVKTEEIKELPEYKILDKNFKAILQIEKDLLYEGVKLIEDTELWEWCLRTKGLKEMAAMTFAGFINPDKEVKDKKTGLLRKVRISDVWSYFGLTPDSRLKESYECRFCDQDLVEFENRQFDEKKEYKDHIKTQHPEHINDEIPSKRKTYNKIAKARVLGVICPNLIRSQDKYYSDIYYAKKNYYLNRPDLVSKYSKKGIIRSVTHKMSIRKLGVYLISHAFELMLDDDDVRRDEMKKLRGAAGEKFAMRHRVPIPVKPADSSKIPQIIAEYTSFHAKMLEELKRLWIEGGNKESSEYMEYLKYNRLSK